MLDFECVITWWCLNDALCKDYNCIPTLQWRWYTALCCHDFAPFCMDRTVSCWHWASREYVDAYWGMLKMADVIAWCSMHALFNRNWILMYCTNALQWQWHTAAPDWFWFLLNVWNGVGFALLGRAESTLILVHVKNCSCYWLFSVRWTHYCLVFEISCVISDSTTMAMTHGSGLILILLDCMERCRSWWHWASRKTKKYVNIGASWNLKVLLLGVWCIIIAY